MNVSVILRAIRHILQKYRNELRGHVAWHHIEAACSELSKAETAINLEGEK